MVQRRAACSGERNASLNDVPGDIRKGRISSDGEIPASVVIQGIAGENTLGRGRFSLFRWFRRAGQRDSVGKRKSKSEDDRKHSVSSSAESVNTFYSTTTVRSFAFHAGTLNGSNGLSLDILKQTAEVGPFAAGASKVTVGNKRNDVDVSCTLPASVHKRDITTRYSLQPSATFNSCRSFPVSDRRFSLRKPEDSGKVTCNGAARRRAYVKGKRKAPNPPVVTKPEVDAREPKSISSNRRKRRAPRPPERAETITENTERTEAESTVKDIEPKDADGGMDVEERKEEVQTISNDTLMLQSGVLLSKKEVAGPKIIKDSEAAAGLDPIVLPENHVQTSNVGTLGTAMPRPWYKRSMFEHSRDSNASRRGGILRGPTTSSIEVKEECVASNVATPGGTVDASLSKLSFFHRGERQADDRKREIKRKSGLSILTNISELDKEAAAIVQEEQARARASMLLNSSRFVDAFENRSKINEELVQDIVSSAMGNSSPRRGTRALISKFNAISNITKVTVNTNFFARTRDQQGTKFERDVVRSSRFEQATNWQEQPRYPVQHPVQDVRIERDISRYFPPQQRSSKYRMETPEMDTKPGESKVTLGKENNDCVVTETSNRISLLQSQLTANQMNNPVIPLKETETPVIQEQNKWRQEVAEERKGKETKLNNDGTKGYPFFRSRVLNESTENASGSNKESRQENKKEIEGVQKEFSHIFDEIDRQLRSKNSKLIDCRAIMPAGESANEKIKVHEDEAGISSKVTKVLDILVETEKDNKARMAQQEKSIPIENVSRLIDADAKSKSSKAKSPILSTTEDQITTDLKEMLKEMKHSLPKRPKPKKPVTKDTVPMEKIDTEKNPSSKCSSSLQPVTKIETASQNDYETNRQKVSSSVQTNGNIRRVNQPPTEKPSTSGWRQENVVYRTSGRNLGRVGLVKNTFQLIRPRDFAEIEAMKTAKRPYNENTYANVIEQSLYANTHVPPPLSKHVDSTHSKDIQESSDAKVSNMSPLKQRKFNIPAYDLAKVDEENHNVAEKNMNTLAINRLLKKLEAAIASGNHQQAAGLAKELAQLKIHCSVVRQCSARSKDQLIKVNMYIEDKLAHQGPIPLQLPTRMTVAELKRKVYTEFEIPTNVQRWIIGKNLADRDEITLDELQTVDGSPIFLYLVAPELQNEAVAQKNKPEVTEEFPNITDEAAEVETLQPTTEVQEASQEETVKPHIPEENKMKRYEELISLENCDVIPNSEPIECPICFVTYGPREGVILRDCLHMFCRPCLANTVLYCEDAEVKCPYRDTEYTCESTLQEREIKALVEPEVYQQHLAKSVAQAENNAGNNAFHCKTPDCPGWCIYDDNVNNFLCPVCGANNCLTCQAIHTGKNCKQYQQKLQLLKETDQESRRTAEMLEEMVDRGEALACPTCAVVLMKKWGCDWLRCSMCKTEICWVTRGPRWGPGGKGDTSGGCRCGENGVKCHPRCNYCH